MIAVAGLARWTATLRPASPGGADDGPPRLVRDRLAWIALAFVPSAMLIAVTSHISTDIASAPFLWVVPLAIFLGTFIFTFRNGGERPTLALCARSPSSLAPL